MNNKVAPTGDMSRERKSQSALARDRSTSGAEQMITIPIIVGGKFDIGFTDWAATCPAVNWMRIRIHGAPSGFSKMKP
ncbi:hypothetical protein LB519_21130 [Mesorhizobium sp. AD1-1]|uniref:hypothetical protein n=1 Tax=Mesorhizobium sp. AD1-1 TaxID=2876621 RepID=UPI001CCD4498|nr:hypothetical protein [Mesorhizobium sp. AD1-1]MBZ9720350.1 hypothetical protein [Mesorhizobium sp. AD1-1]